MATKAKLNLGGALEKKWYREQLSEPFQEEKQDASDFNYPNYVFNQQQRILQKIPAQYRDLIQKYILQVAEYKSLPGTNVMMHLNEEKLQEHEDVLRGLARDSKLLDDQIAILGDLLKQLETSLENIVTIQTLDQKQEQEIPIEMRNRYQFLQNSFYLPIDPHEAKRYVNLKRKEIAILEFVSLEKKKNVFVPFLQSDLALDEAVLILLNHPNMLPRILSLYNIKNWAGMDQLFDEAFSRP